MFRLIKCKIQEIFLANKAKNYWRNCDKWPLKDISVDIYNNQIKAAREFFIPLLQKDSSVLDLGCGDGWFSFEIAPLVYHVDAIDI
jgi:2-polyprenyl-3-methyl-5-hydroxy-6-metoxy-1,4-benzoquinol methylase